MGKDSTDECSTHEVAEICQVSPPTVVRWIEQGHLPARRTPGGHRRISRAALEAFCLKQGLATPTEHTVRPRVMVLSLDSDERAALCEAVLVAEPSAIVDTALDAFEAGRIVGAHRPRVVIFDERAAGGDLEAVCARLKAEPSFRALQFIVLGAAGSARQRTLRRFGAFAHLGRPVDGRQVTASVRAALFANPESSRGPRVLIVDGDVDAARDMQRQLEQHGVEVLVAEEGEEALLLTEAACPELILLDLLIPDLDGIDIAKRLHARPDHRDTRVVMMAARADDKTRLRARNAGASTFLAKPVTATHVLALLLPDRSS